MNVWGGSGLGVDDWDWVAYFENKIKFQIRASDMESSLMQEKKLNLSK